MTDWLSRPHSIEMFGVAPLPATARSAEATRAAVETPPFEKVYDAYFPYIWRSVLRLGVPLAQADDAVQEVFLVVHRKLGDFEGRSSLKTWLYGIALRIARAHRAGAPREIEPDELSAPEASRPDERAQQAEAAQVVRTLLALLDDDQREVFVLAELEQLTAPEIAEALGVKLNTVYSRLRLAREAFAQGAARFRAADRWRMR